MVIRGPLLVLLSLLQIPTVSLDGSVLDCAEGTDLGTETVTVILHVLLTASRNTLILIFMMPSK